VMFIGTKKQAQEAVAEQATRVGMPYVNQRWLGGMLTNFQTVYKRLQRMKELGEIDFTDVAASGLTKKELLVLEREHTKLEKTLGGIRDMQRVPSAVWIVDTKKEHIAVGEARKLRIPVVAILDTNCDPDEVDYKIPGNDDAIRSAALLTRVIADGVAEGLVARAAASANAGRDVVAEPGRVGGDEPLADWERELLTPAAEPSVALTADPGQQPIGAESVAPAAEVADAADDVRPEAGGAVTDGAGEPAAPAAPAEVTVATPAADAAPVADAISADEATPVDDAAAPVADATPAADAAPPAADA
jgi:small subunit ribosomal protein S2